MTEEALIPRIWVRRFSALAGLALVLSLAYAIRSTVAPFLLAWIAAYLATPLVDALETRLHIRRESGVIVVMLLCLLIVVLALSLAVPIIINESVALANSIPAYREKLSATFEAWKASGRIPPQAEQMARVALTRLQDAAPQIATQLGEWAFSGLSSLYGLLEMALNLLLGVFVFYYFLRDFHVINERMIEAAPPAWHDEMKDLLGEIDANLRTVLRGQFLVALAMAVLYGTGLGIAGVPYFILIGLIAGFGNFLPYIGPMLGMLPAFLFVFLHTAGDLASMTTPVIGIVVVFGVVQFLEGFVLTPRLAGKSVGLGPVAVLFALSVGGALLGLVGVVAALPMAAIMKVVLKRGWNLYKGSQIHQKA